VSALPPHLDPAALLSLDAGAELDDVARALLRPLPGVGVAVFDRELRSLLAEGPLLASGGYGSGLVRGRTFEDFIVAAVAEQVVPHLRAVIETGERRTFEVASVAGRHDGNGGRTYALVAGPVVDADGAVAGGVCLAFDVTDRARAGRTLAEAEAHYRLLADTATDVVTLHSLDGRYQYVSPSIVSVAGYTPQEMLGRRANEFVHPEDLPGLYRYIEGLGNGRAAGSWSYRHRRPDGTWMWMESSITVIREQVSGRVRELRVSSRDVSARVEHEARAAAATEELRRRLAQTSALARLGEQALEDPNLGTLLETAVRIIAETLEVPLAAATEIRGLGEPPLVRAGVGWGPGVVGSLIDVVERNDERALELLSDGPVDDVSPHLRSTAMVEHGVRSSVFMLVGERDAPWGVLSAHDLTERGFDDHDRDFLQAVGHVVGDAVRRRRSEEAARHHALHDRLTGLPNRTLLVDRMHQGMRRRADGRMAVLLLDLDDLKMINESLGHGAGDAVLCEVGPRLTSALRPGDTIARFAGDTFAVVCEEIVDETHAQRLAERVAGAFGRPFVLGDEQLFVTARVGVVLSSGTESPEDLLRDADAALYRAKESGHRYELFDPRLRERAIARLRTESDLRRALSRNELRLQYQPYWNLPDRTLAGVEALVRWQHPERGLVPPGEFIPIAEESGLVVPLGTWVLREACRQLAVWRREHPEAAATLRMRVNLSARQVSQPGLVDLVARALEDHAIPAEALGLEITEGLLMQDSEAVASTLRGIKELGIRLVLDDFGTGYSSLSYLQRFPIDQLKIDRSFVFALEERDESRAIVRAIVGMAHALGLGVVPEGVETEEQLATLIEMGCEFAQGFLLARPLDPAAVAELL